MPDMSDTLNAIPQAEEYFDVVDVNDCVVDRQPRSVVHALRLRHRAAHVLVFDHQDRIYLQRRALTKDCSPGRWDSSAAGHVGSGEDYDTAARRELEEELGIRVETPLEPLFRLDASAATGFEFVRVYRARTDQTPRPDPSEIIDGRWCTSVELAEWLRLEPAAFTASFVEIWRRLQAD